MLQALAAVPDQRNARGRRHSLQSVLLLAVGAVLAGARSYAAIAQWARCAQQEVAVCGPTPHATTFGRVLAAVGPAALQRALTGWVLTRRAARRRRHAHDAQPRGEGRTVLAVDGKTLRGAREAHGQQAKLVAVLDHAEHLALSQVQVVDGDELAAFVPVLDTLADLHGVVVTADAVHCQRAHADYLHARGAHYLFTVKANPAHAAPRPGPAALGPGARAARTQRRARPHGVPLDQGHRPGQHAGGIPVSARRPGDQNRPATPRSRPRQGVGGDGLRDHLPGPPRRRSAATGRLDPFALDDRELPALGPRRHRGRGPLQRAHRTRPAGHGRPAQHRDQHHPTPRRDQHRRRPPRLQLPTRRRPRRPHRSLIGGSTYPPTSAFTTLQGPCRPPDPAEPTTPQGVVV